MDAYTLIDNCFKEGHDKVNIVYSNGSKDSLRLFMSTSGVLAYKKKGSTRHGYAVSGLSGIIDVSPCTTKKQLTVKEDYLNNLSKFKKLFATKCHPNLWTDLQEGYAKLDVDLFDKFMKAQGTDTNDRHEMYKSLCAFCKDNDIHILTENRYKTTTLTSNKRNKWDKYPESIVEKIKDHLDKKEDFHYYWNANYDVSMEGKQCDSGYKGWFSLEFKGCGNGHYYLLVNENLAVFAEDD